MIAEMGVKAPKSSYESKLAARQRFRAGVFAVIAANRMRTLEREWRGVKRMGDGLRRKREGIEAGRSGGR
jgi:Pericentrin-AKAP-450 domain of centrosomal targeting protein